MNYASWRLIDRSGKNSEKTYVPKGTTDSIIIIIIIIIKRNVVIRALSYL